MKKKVLSSLMSIVMLFTMIPATLQISVHAEGPDKFTTAAYANHWGRSDLRSYLNGVTKEDNTLPIDTTNHNRQPSGYYESKFTDAEFGLIKPFTYKTNVLDNSENATEIYETTDRFWLLSGHYNKKIVSWGSEDISSNAQYNASYRKR